MLGFENIDKKRLLKDYIFSKYDSRFEQLTIQSKYEVHLIKQKSSIFSYKQDQQIKIQNINYKEIEGCQ